MSTYVPSSSTADIEGEEWEYNGTLESDPRLRSRVLSHTLLGGASDDLTESWTYGAGSDYWPTAHESLADSSSTGRETLYTWNSAGQLLTRTVEDVDTQSETYDIVEEYSYNANGQPLKAWDPNRSSATPDAALTENVYLSEGLNKGWREKQYTRLKSGTIQKTVSWTYDEAGRVATETDPLGGVTTWVQASNIPATD